jgi:divinyl chlorophyllide a 8-vinyl-reductase
MIHRHESRHDEVSEIHAQRARVFVAGATGTIGRATARALLDRGHEVVCLVRPRTATAGDLAEPGCRRRRPSPQRPRARAAARDGDACASLRGAELRFGQITDARSLAADGFRGERFDAVVSCIASRTGAPADAWAIDHAAQSRLLQAAQAAGVRHFVLLSAICVQRPRLAFQHAKLAFERALMDSGVPYSIVRPTAFFKSLSGQFERVRSGRPFLLFGDGALTACKPIADEDLGEFIAACLEHPQCVDQVLPIGGPGEAITPRAQGEMLFAAWVGPPVQARTAGAARRDRDGADPARQAQSVARRQGGTGPHRPLLRHRVHVGLRTPQRPLRSRGDALDGDADARATSTPRWPAGEAQVDRGDHAVF